MALLLVIVLMAVGIRSCESSQQHSALINYAGGVTSVVQRSEATSQQFFRVLTSSRGVSSATSLATQLNAVLHSANNDLDAGGQLSPPSQMQDAQRNLVLALTMRRDAVSNVANQIQRALEPGSSNQAVSAIASEMARLYASDAVYKDYVVPSIYAALGQNGIASSQVPPVAEPQFLPGIDWLLPADVAQALHTSYHSGSATSTSTKPGPGTHGHELLSVSVNGTTLQTGSTNTLPANPTFTFSFRNSGTVVENNVACKVSINTSSDTGQQIVAQTTPGENATCSVTLNSPPPSGSGTVTATVAPVPGETHIANNTLTFPVTFQ